jgi:hypothetical protein
MVLEPEVPSIRFATRRHVQLQSLRGFRQSPAGLLLRTIRPARTQVNPHGRNRPGAELVVSCGPGFCLGADAYFPFDRRVRI